MSSHENNSDQEKEIEGESVTNSMNLDEDENNDEENGNYSSNNNISSLQNNSNFPPKTSSTKKHQKKSSKISKKAKHNAKKSKYANKSQRELSGNELAQNLDKQTKERFLYKPFYSLPDLTPFLGEIIEVRVASEFLSSLNKAYVDLSGRKFD